MVRTLSSRRKRSYEANEQLKFAFMNGNPDKLNQSLTAEEQSAQLPYDSSFEVRKDAIHLGKYLGAGTFSEAYKADLVGLVEDKPSICVTMKRPKDRLNNSQLRTIAGQLKLSIHVGKHLNIRKLIGAYTVNYDKGELWLLVEYCSYGDLHSFLQRNRDRFIDQSVAVSTGRQKPEPPLPGPSGGVTPNLLASPEDVMVDIQGRPQSTDGCGENTLFNTSQLICWAWQVAQAMEFLHRRKVLHGDLAARNILLDEKNVIKINNFGLSRDMYRKEKFRVPGDELQAKRWMSIEVIRDRNFSIESDIWSYGILLWELFSLGQVPYPDQEINDQFLAKLEKGKRCSKPKFSNEFIYKLMEQCWAKQPQERPRFSSIIDSLQQTMNKKTTEKYLKMNESFQRENEKYFEDHRDYLKDLATPDLRSMQRRDAEAPYTNLQNTVGKGTSTFIKHVSLSTDNQQTQPLCGVPMVPPRDSTVKHNFSPPEEVTNE